MNKKLIFLDIDGTLTEAGSNIPPVSAQEAVKKARANGHLVFLCTGRNYDMMKALIPYGFDGYISSSGGYVVCGEDVIYDCPMTPEQEKNVLGTLEKNGIFRTIECHDGSYTDEGFKEFLEQHANEEGNSELLRWRKAIEESLNIRPMSEWDGAPVYKVVVMSPGLDKLLQAKELLKEEFETVIQDTKGAGIVNGEVVNRKFDKGQAVVRVAQHLGIDISDTIGYGDSMNDKEMMETVGLAVCMANGSETLKKMADEIAPSVSEDGLARSFEMRGLI